MVVGNVGRHLYPVWEHLSISRSNPATTTTKNCGGALRLAWAASDVVSAEAQATAARGGGNAGAPVLKWGAVAWGWSGTRVAFLEKPADVFIKEN